MKIFTHRYMIVFFENTRFCWKNKGWVKQNKMKTLEYVSYVGMGVFIYVTDIPVYVCFIGLLAACLIFVINSGR